VDEHAAPGPDQPAPASADGTAAGPDGVGTGPELPAGTGIAGSGHLAGSDGPEPGRGDGQDRDGGDGGTPPLRRILEAILLVVDEPVPEVDLAQVVEQPRAVVAATLSDLSATYDADGRGFELRQVGAGWRLYTAADCAPYVERFVLEGQQARLTQAALATLAVVAYRQPVSRATIAAIRGVNVDGVVRTLVGRGLITTAGEEGPGGAHLYVTTPYFLERLGLRSPEELPNLAPFLPTSLEEIEKEL
jgi:segregation and condensation protein B